VRAFAEFGEVIAVTNNRVESTYTPDEAEAFADVLRSAAREARQESEAMQDDVIAAAERALTFGL
jgi:hypothetical protein